MTKCKYCSGLHSTRFHVVNKLSDQGFPKSSKRYEAAHKKADAAEKKAFPKGYKEMKNIDAKLGRHELAGKNLKSGEIEISKKVPPRLRKEVAMHEKVERRELRKKDKKKV